MWNERPNPNEIAETLSLLMKTAEILPEVDAAARHAEAIDLLIKASENLDDGGMVKQATKLIKVVKKLSWYVPNGDSPKSSDKMVSNLKQKGWVFDADDGTATNNPQSKDLSTGLTAKKMVDSLGPGMSVDTSQDDDGKASLNVGTTQPAKPVDKPVDKADPEKPFELPKPDKPATTPVTPVGVVAPKPDPLKG